MQMRLHAQLKKRGASDTLALRICELGVKNNMKTLISWSLCGRRRMIDVGLTAAESGELVVILHSTRVPALSSSGNSVVLESEAEPIATDT